MPSARDSVAVEISCTQSTRPRPFERAFHVWRLYSFDMILPDAALDNPVIATIDWNLRAGGSGKLVPGKSNYGCGHIG